MLVDWKADLDIEMVVTEGTVGNEQIQAEHQVDSLPSLQVGIGRRHHGRVQVRIRTAHVPPDLSVEAGRDTQGIRDCQLPPGGQAESSISFLSSAMARAGLRPFGHATVQFMMV